MLVIPLQIAVFPQFLINSLIIMKKIFEQFIVPNRKAEFLQNPQSIYIYNYKRMDNTSFQGRHSQNRLETSILPENSLERSREKNKPSESVQDRVYTRKFTPNTKKLDKFQKQSESNHFLNPSQQSDRYLHQSNQNDRFKQVIRSLLRIQQGRDEPIDKFAKIVWTFKNKIRYDFNLHEIMIDPKAYISKLTHQQIIHMLPVAEQHRQYQCYKKNEFQQYWNSIVGILKSQLDKLKNNEQIKQDHQYKIRQIIEKPLPELIKLEKQATLILKNQSFGSSNQYWKFVLQQVKSKKTQLILKKYYEDFKAGHREFNDESMKHEEQYVCQEPTSPILIPYTSVNSKLIVTEQQEKQSRKKLAQTIFRQQFQKGQQRLERNLSLPHNHSLLSTEIITEQTNTYDQIAKEIIQFEKYKRMEDDEQQFNDWVPCETEGRFRDQKPFYLNRVRVACEWNKYNSSHYNEDNPPPKTIQGYKFNVFYPQLYDKQKTPQYYLEGMDDPTFCIIKFKAGPPYKDIAFKIMKKQWDFTQKSGFESIFSKGILQLYFNFKKPKYRI